MWEGKMAGEYFEKYGRGYRGGWQGEMMAKDLEGACEVR
jgi:hypothetical protein